MKAFNFFLTRPIFLLLGILMSSLTANAAIPEINSSLTASATIGQAFSYTITTASNDATGYGTSSDLPGGITRSGAILSGVPTEAGIHNVTLYATNADGIDSETLVLTVSNPVPVINSSLEASGRVGQSFSYTISASNSPDSYSTIDLSAIGLTLDTATGIISGTPTIDIDIDVTVSATNSAGTGDANVVFRILPALSAPSQPTVEIVSPNTGTILEGTTTQISVVANVTPVPGETIYRVFLRWNNPSAPLTPVELAEMSLVSTNSTTGVETYRADVVLGFNPNDRELGGGSIQMEAVALQTNALSNADEGTDNVTLTIKPILEFLFPTEDYAMDSIEVGDVFASVRMNTNTFASVTARIAGVSVIEVTPAITIESNNEVYNFSSSQRIDFPGFYDIRITGLDTNGNTTIIERRIQISDTLAEPVAELTSPTPGFTNEVFSPAVLSFNQTGIEAVIDSGTLVGYNITWRLALISGGQGYYPRDGDRVVILATDSSGITLGVQDVIVVNGRVDALPDELTRFVPLGAPRWDTSGNAVMDDLSDPGLNGRISIAGQFFKANSELDFYKIFVNGEDVTPFTTVDVSDVGATLRAGTVYEILTSGGGTMDFTTLDADNNDVGTIFTADTDFVATATLGGGTGATGKVRQVRTGNLDPLSGAIDVPVLSYPGPGLGSPVPGDYIAYAQVTDKEGEVGTSESLSFSIVPYEPLAITLSRQGVGDIEQGDSEVIFAEVTPISFVEKLEFFDSDSGVSLGLASSIVIGDQSLFRFARDFDQQGRFGMYAIATGFNGQTSRSNPLEILVTPVNDLSVTITSPATDVSVFKGESLTFAATASSTAGVASVVWVVNNEVQETDAAEPFEYTRLFDTIGSYRVLARATDNYGYIMDSSEIIVTVSASDLLVSLDNPTVDQTLVQGGSLNFAATATASLGVDRVEWSVDGEIVETDTSSPYSLTHSFATVGSSSVFARAYDSVGNVATSDSINVQVTIPNPLLSDGDFVADIYTRLFGRSPIGDELATALGSLDGKLESRASLVVDLLQSDNLQTATIASLIYLTMTGEYPDATELEDAINTLTNNGTGVTSANALTTELVSEYESRFAVLNTNAGFVTQLFKNKHSGVSPDAQSLVSLYNTLTGGARSIDDNGFLVVPGYSGDTISFATQFALDNNLSGFQGVTGLPLTSLHYYSIPNRPAEDSIIVILISAILGVEPTNTEINAFSSVSLIDAVRSVLTDSRYYTQFPTSSADGIVAQSMAGFGVFDANLVSASDDADGDGVSNYAEILLNTDPSDGSLAPTAADSLVAQGMIDLGVVDPSLVSASDDADGDGVSNYAEILLNTDPSDGSLVPTAADSFVAQRMIDLGLVDPSLVSASDDADGDGVSNIAEILLNTNPSNTNDEPTASGSSSIDGTDFVFEFVRLKSSLTPIGASVVVECADETFTFAPVSGVDYENLPLSTDQTGITSDYERVEYRVDTSSIGCSFFRLSAQ
jgi:hypothetical protein